jgi:hypothetical protein
MNDERYRVQSDRRTRGGAATTASVAEALRPRPEGWGADLDPHDRPAVPKERMPARLEGVHWEHPAQQPQHVKVLSSVERPGITPVFGTSAPPSGLSGALRGVAFGYSESDLRHWLLLLLADRINVGEGLVADLARGHVPNILGEMGWRAELKHNPAGALRKAMFVAGTAALVVMALRRRGRRG